MIECDRRKDKLSPDVYSYPSSREYYYKEFITGQSLEPNLVDLKSIGVNDSFEQKFEQKKK